MKVREAIKNLGYLNPEDDIVMAWWERDGFVDTFPNMDDSGWSHAVEMCDSKMDWSYAHEDIASTIEESLRV